MESLTLCRLTPIERLLADEPETSRTPEHDPDYHAIHADPDAAQPPGPPFPFNDLPKEVRLLIWEESLRQQSSSRIVILTQDSFEVLPTRALASPLLRANAESRSCALAFFDLRLPVFDLPTTCPAVPPERSRGTLHLSPGHDVFAAGLALEPLREERNWDMPSLKCGFARAHYAPRPVPHPAGAPIPVPARHRTVSMRAHRARIATVLSVCADGCHHATDSPASCACQRRRYPESLARAFWPAGSFPGLRRHLFFPWGPGTRARAEALLRLLFRMGPGRALPAEYRPRELAWEKYAEIVCGDAPYEVRAENVLAEPGVEEFRPCYCALDKQRGDGKLHERLTILEIMQRMHEASIRSPSAP
ncbi:hypothetical protein F4804DRAFT_347732 [Jackrogersella minutella]|nr:hypothetical protein F4804DRAFT_347732 [Jackrogersella minutella]